MRPWEEPEGCQEAPRSLLLRWNLDARSSGQSLSASEKRRVLSDRSGGLESCQDTAHLGQGTSGLTAVTLEIDPQKEEVALGQVRKRVKCGAQASHLKKLRTAASSGRRRVDQRERFEHYLPSLSVGHSVKDAFRWRSEGPKRWVSASSTSIKKRVDEPLLPGN